MFAAEKTLTTTTPISSRGGQRGKEVVQKSRSSMRSTRRNDVNVVVRAEAQKTIDMNEVRFTKIDSFIVFVARSCRCFLYSGMEKGSIFLLLCLLLLLLLDPSSSADGTKDIVAKWIKYRGHSRLLFIHARVMFCWQNRNFSLSLSFYSLARITFASRTRILCSTTKTTNTSRKS